VGLFVALNHVADLELRIENPKVTPETTDPKPTTQELTTHNPQPQKAARNPSDLPAVLEASKTHKENL